MQKHFLKTACVGAALAALAGLIPAAEAATTVRINEIVASNQTGVQDEEGIESDWIEMFHAGTEPVNLEGWSLTDDPDQPRLWLFPSVTLQPGQYLLVFASGNDRRPAQGNLHTNFKLSAEGEYLGLFGPSATVPAASEIAPAFPGLPQDVSYGLDAAGQWRFFQEPTPGAANPATGLVEWLKPVAFSLERSLLTAPLSLQLTSADAGAEIRYTTDGSAPEANTGRPFTEPIQIGTSTVVRAAAFRAGSLASAVGTHSYLFATTEALASLPVISLGAATNDLIGPTGILGMSGGTYTNIDGIEGWVSTGPDDYFNPTNRGIEWERPVSMELIDPAGTPGFQTDAGFRVQGSLTRRPQYRPDSKFSFNIFFRGIYGAGKLEQRLFENSSLESYDALTLRAGFNDSSNPFITDELMRRLFADTGHVVSLGEIYNVFLNGEYAGYYNLVERLEEDFIKASYRSTNSWDVIQPFGFVVDGDFFTWRLWRAYARDSSVDLSSKERYLEAEAMADLENFADYLLVNIYGDTGDWTRTNWRMTRERIPEGKWRWHVWDAEFALGIYQRPVSNNTLTNPAQLGDSSEMSQFFAKLRGNPEFRLLFADRVQKHFFNGGALTDENVLRRYRALRDVMRGVLPEMFTYIEDTWVPQRRGVIFQHFSEAGLLAPVEAPALLPHGGKVPSEFSLGIETVPGAEVFYTLDGSDPRERFVSLPAAQAARYAAPIQMPAGTVTVKARAFAGGEWSALTEASFEVGEGALAIRISEIMYHPPDAEAHEFLELVNTGLDPVDLSGFRLDGIGFTFPSGFVIPGRGVVVLGSSENPGSFDARYPGVAVAARFDGRLSNGGETLTLLDPLDQTIFQLTYDDEGGWPSAADGSGYSLEIIDLNGDSSAPGNWRTSAQLWGTPGRHEGFGLSEVRIGKTIIEGGAVRLEFASRPGARYALEARDNLGGGSWVVIEEVEAGGSTSLAEDRPPPTATSRFYRLKLLE